MASALNVPVFITITKIDMCNEEQLTRILASVSAFLASCNKQMFLLSGLSGVNEAVAHISSSSSSHIVVMAVSSVTGHGFDVFKAFLFALPSRCTKAPDNLTTSDPTSDLTKPNPAPIRSNIEFHVEDVFQVQDVGTVLSGTLQSGTIRLNHSSKTPSYYYLGPDKRGSYQRVKIKSIHRQRTPVDQIESGQSATLALYDIDRKFVRSGMVLLGDNNNSSSKPQQQQRINPSASTTTLLSRQSSFSAMDKAGISASFASRLNAFYEIEARVQVISAPKPIYPRQNGILHVGCVKQTAALKQICHVFEKTSEERLDSSAGPACAAASGVYATPSLVKDDEAIVRFRFIVRPEFVKKGAKLVYRNGKTRMVGQVTHIITDDDGESK